jgi:hypothetical protein
MKGQYRINIIENCCLITFSIFSLSASSLSFRFASLDVLFVLVFLRVFFNRTYLIDYLFNFRH